MIAVLQKSNTDHGGWHLDIGAPELPRDRRCFVGHMKDGSIQKASEIVRDVSGFDVPGIDAAFAAPELVCRWEWE